VGEHGRSKASYTFDGWMLHIRVDLTKEFAEQSLWPKERAGACQVFTSLWDLDSPWLFTRVGPSRRKNPPLHLEASLRIRRILTTSQWCQIHTWVRHEVDAFEDALHKILTRRRQVSGRRAFELAKRKLARHVRPCVSLISEGQPSQGLLVLRFIGELFDEPRATVDADSGQAHGQALDPIQASKGDAGRGSHEAAGKKSTRAKGPPPNKTILLEYVIHDEPTSGRTADKNRAPSLELAESSASLPMTPRARDAFMLERGPLRVAVRAGALEAAVGRTAENRRSETG
jgi:hypothetical protein